MVAEVTVRIKSDETTITERFLSYDPFELSHEDPILNGYVAETISKCQGQLTDPEIIVKIKMVWS